MRHCGECQVCCVFFDVPEVDKIAGLPCKNLTPAGCGIHPTRPTVCRTYKCLWLRGMLSDLDRPDQSGMLVSLPALDNEVFRETGIMVLIVDQATPGALDSEAGKAVLSDLTIANVVVAKRGARRTVMGPADLVEKVSPILERLTVSPLHVTF